MFTVGFWCPSNYRRMIDLFSLSFDSASGVILVNEPISPKQVHDDDMTLPKKQS